MINIRFEPYFPERILEFLILIENKGKVESEFLKKIRNIVRESLKPIESVPLPLRNVHSSFHCAISSSMANIIHGRDLETCLKLMERLVFEFQMLNNTLHEVAEKVTNEGDVKPLKELISKIEALYKNNLANSIIDAVVDRFIHKKNLHSVANCYRISCKSFR